MGNKAPLADEKLISFPKCVEMGYVRGGDLLFIQDQSYFDRYTVMNTQTLHAFKKHLRLKMPKDDPQEVGQWCRIGIILDSDVEAIKYVLELTATGFKKTEYMTRVLQLKADKQIIGFRRLEVPLTQYQSDKLRHIADYLSDVFGEEASYKELWQLEPSEQGEPEVGAFQHNPNVKPEKSNIYEGNKKDKSKGKVSFAIQEDDEKFAFNRPSKAKDDPDFEPANNSDEDEPPAERENPYEYVEMIRNAFVESKKILGKHDQHGHVFASMWEIFNIFAGKKAINPDDEEDLSESSMSDMNTIEDATNNEKKTLQLIMLPQFLKYFKVASSDEFFFDETIRKMAVLAESEYYCTHGLTFSHLLLELHEKGFFIGCELTEKEPNAVINAQVMLFLLEKIQVIDSSERQSGFFRDVSDLDVASNIENHQFAKFVYYPTRTVWYSI